MKDKSVKIAHARLSSLAKRNCRSGLIENSGKSKPTPSPDEEMPAGLDGMAMNDRLEVRLDMYLRWEKYA